ncbi:MAG: hypothetical protein Ct9H300mP8_08850 [Gammaproteobacteria bacterium]|nr:MAG: hypothetical protein Ct9H300mP8_08850 [Gammaproteobacteria bacterium]
MVKIIASSFLFVRMYVAGRTWRDPFFGVMLERILSKAINRSVRGKSSRTAAVLRMPASAGTIRSRVLSACGGERARGFSKLRSPGALVIRERVWGAVTPASQANIHKPCFHPVEVADRCARIQSSRLGSRTTARSNHICSVVGLYARGTVVERGDSIRAFGPLRRTESATK